MTNNLRFPGQYADEETGLHYNWNRYYDSTSGRYFERDPIGLQGGINLFLYVQENPVNIIDPSGRSGLGIAARGAVEGIQTIIQALRKSGDFHWYGEYGGPGWTGGEWRTWNDIPSNQIIPTPVDSQDWAYFRHDQCYGQCRKSCKKTMSDCFNICDYSLAKELSELGFRPSQWEFPAADSLRSNVHRFFAIPVFKYLQPTMRNLSK